ncbi:MAG: P22 phage major capsid protein family protein, partial [Ignavibacteria bacterium]|nr:P22 phage major capsid protein family protein [Ignavibacteria bacterium]
MANTFKTASVITQEIALQLYNALRLGRKVHRYASKDFANKGSGIPGPTINVPMPIRYLAKEGPTLSPQPIIERTIPVTMDQDFHVGLDMTVFDMTLNTDDDITKMSSKYIQPAIKVLADKVDDYLAGLALKLYNASGAAGTTPGSGTLAETLQLLANTERIMTEAGIPDNEERCIFLDPKGAGYLPIALAATFVREAQQVVSNG